MIFILDNYDSFTYNLFQYVGTIQPDVKVMRNDAVSVQQVLEMKPDRIIISPGPGYPADAGICIPLIQQAGEIPILGVCLGHQAIGEAFGSKIVHAPQVMHGKADVATVDTNCKLFHGLQTEVQVGRYHSLVIAPETLPEELQITAQTSDECIMAVQHKTRPVYGIQFHPESVLTPDGMQMIRNFLEG
ncbi:anthranilate synthase component II [Massilioclostridium coli]|uniref:anthranilate synthase component II n=1 Tax=Massilioclostridium coli TaxID=1870991 RepID=UPI0022E786BE|nr:aminodeoxychorismate/anthranilate synthase component II [Massilioclostridium coli]